MSQTTVLENINQILEKLPEPIQIQILQYIAVLNDFTRLRRVKSPTRSNLI